jgi:hypothetical protein
MTKSYCTKIPTVGGKNDNPLQQNAEVELYSASSGPTVTYSSPCQRETRKRDKVETTVNVHVRSVVVIYGSRRAAQEGSLHYALATEKHHRETMRMFQRGV